MAEAPEQLHPLDAAQVSASTTWSFAGAIADRALRFLVFIIIARLVTPQAFGLVVLCLLLVEMFQTAFEAGLATTLIRESELDRPALDTAFTAISVVGLLSSALTFFAAAPFAQFARQPAATALLQVLAISPFLSALGKVHVALMERRLGFKALAGRTVVASIIASLTAIGLAYLHAGAWALITRSLLLAGAGTVLAWRAEPYRPKLRLHRHVLASLGRPSFHLWASGIVGQLNSRGFDAIAGLTLGAAALGAFRIAGQTVLLLMELTIGPLTAVGYAALSRGRDDPARFRATFALMVDAAALLIFPVFAGLYVISDPLIGLLFGDRWAPAAGLLPFMCAIAPALYVHLLASCALFAVGRTDLLLWTSLFEGAATLIGFIGCRYGLVGLAIAGTLRLYLAAPIQCYWMERAAGVDPWSLLRPGARTLACAVIMAAATAGLKPWLAAILPPLPLLILLVLFGAAVYAGSLLLIARPMLRRLQLGTLAAAPWARRVQGAATA